MARLRLPLAFVLALVVATGLFWFLRVMIGSTGAFEETQARPRIDFVRLRRDTEIEERKRVKPEISKPEPPPSAPAVSASEKTSVVPGADVAALAPSVDFAALGGGGGAGAAAQLALGGGTDRDAAPQVRIQPDYPVQARQRRIEGWVDVQFTVAADGSVRDPVVLDSEPETIFDRAALQAIKGWKYSPRIEDGKPVERPGLKVRIRFTLES